MFIERDDIISDPYDRDIFTSNLSPSLASHAPNVSIMILIVGRVIDVWHKIMGINNTVGSIIPSKHKRDIRKWDRCNKKAINIA